MTTPEKREDVEALIARLTRLAADAPTMISRETLNETTSLLEELRQAREENAAWLETAKTREAETEARWRELLDETAAAERRALKAEEGRDKARADADLCAAEWAKEIEHGNSFRGIALKAEEQRKALMKALKPFASLILDGDPEDPIPESGTVHCLIMGEGELGDLDLKHFRHAAEVYAHLSEDADQPLLKTEGEGNQEHTVSVAESGGSPTTSGKSDSPHSAGGGNG